MFKQNQINIVGILSKAEVKLGKMKEKGNDYVSVKAEVVSTFDGVDHTYEIEFFSSAVKADGKENKLYSIYSKMNELEGQTVQVSGSLRENLFYSSKTKEVSSSIKLIGRFINAAPSNTPHAGTFTLGGVILTTLGERTNKNQEIYKYDFKLGQANYNENNLSAFVVSVKPDAHDIIKGIRAQYPIGTAVSIHGVLDFIVTENTVEDKNIAFGQPVFRVYRNYSKNLYMTGGSKPLTDPEEIYAPDVLSELCAAYKEAQREVKENAKAAEEQAQDVPTSPTMNGVTSLL